MANSIEVLIGNHRYVLKSEESEPHLMEVAEMVRRRIESTRKKSTSLSIQKSAILAAFDLASDLIKAKRKVTDQRSKILTKAHEVLARVERELEATRSPSS